MKRTSLVMRLAIAITFLQSLFFKFSGHEQVIHVFSTIGLEPLGRYVIGIIELIISILLFIPKTRILALISSGILMLCALSIHLLTSLGIVVEWNNRSDNGKLFGMGLMVCILALFLLFRHYKKNQPINSIKKLIGF